ncbi:MAG: 50S ribosomal protein L30 [Clostridiales bacterium]|uniref:50S ribosomal protein L30 n=1 Tax=Anaerocaecibacter muris TaxID=2941513 RepID=UPI0023CBEB6D|nr:50S ribosomal protein L30 [Clostridiales bacterium]
MAKKAEKTENKKLNVTLVKSVAGRLEKQQRTVEALGLKKLHQTVTVEDNPAMRGMIRTVSHLVTVTEA